MTAAGFVPLATERLLLRPLRPADAAAVHRLVNDWEVAKNLARVPFPYPRQRADEWIASTGVDIAADRAWHLAVTATDTLVGCIGLTRDSAGAGAELGYWIGRPYWGRGYAPEAARRLLDWAFASRGLTGVHASVLLDHPRSQAVLRRLGFREVGAGTSAFLSRGKAMPVRRFAAAGLAGEEPAAPTRVGPDAASAAAGSGPPAKGGGASTAASEAAPPTRVVRDATRHPAPIREPSPRTPTATRQTVPGAARETPQAHRTVPDPAAPPVAGGASLLLVAACALVDPDTRVLLARRPQGKPMAGLWEFPGGKLAPGETPEAALIRELAEELGISVAASCLAPFAFASHPLGERHLLMPLYLCRKWEGTPIPREGQALAWVRPSRLGDYPMPPADVPLVALLRDFL